ATSDAVPGSAGATHDRSPQSGQDLPSTKGDSAGVAELRLGLPGRVRMEMIRIGAGNFLMGSSEEQGKDDERPQHGVRISRDFYLGKFPVTQEQYQAVMGSNPSRFTLTEHHPVDNVSWIDAREFCRRLQAFLHCQSPPNPLRVPIASVGLPTEAEWE